ncbi:hypothetical protein [Nonomuraea sp. NPDC049758]|uniref:hypothetical protein n=1 Tax=Nonomuraea sp. NPDC049758 TaxID=3154360 RepID=UPI0034344E44
MSSIEIISGIGLGLMVNELCDLSPWLARGVVRWAARLQYGRTDRATMRAEELQALINERPGKLFKLVTALGFAAAASAGALRQVPIEWDSAYMRELWIRSSAARYVITVGLLSVAITYAASLAMKPADWPYPIIFGAAYLLGAAIYEVVGKLAARKKGQVPGRPSRSP